jgi:hypothetical protein
MPHAAAMRSSMVSECPVYSASPSRAITDWVDCVFDRVEGAAAFDAAGATVRLATGQRLQVLATALSF